MIQHRLDIDNIKKSYQGRSVVESVSFHINSGEIVGLLGPNGAGKTTCFYMVSGLLTADSGCIKLNNNDIAKLSFDKRALLGLGYLPQESSIFRTLSVSDNIMAVLQTRSNYTQKERLKILASTLVNFKIEHIQYSLGASLSGGERRRVEIARLVSLEPKFILLDEPFAGVDPIAVGELQLLISALKKRDIGVLITDHNFRETLDSCDRTYVLSDGHIIALGNKDAIINNAEVQQKYLGANSHHV